MEEQNVTTSSRSDPVKPVEARNWTLIFPTNLLLVCCHVAMLGSLDVSNLSTSPFPLAVSASCYGSLSSARSLQEAQGEHEWVRMGRCHCNEEVAAHVQNYGADPALGHRDNPQPKPQRLSCPTHCLHGRQEPVGQGLLERTKSMVERTWWAPGGWSSRWAPWMKAWASSYQPM